MVSVAGLATATVIWGDTDMRICKFVLRLVDLYASLSVSLLGLAQHLLSCPAALFVSDLVAFQHISPCCVRAT